MIMMMVITMAAMCAMRTAADRGSRSAKAASACCLEYDYGFPVSLAPANSDRLALTRATDGRVALFCLEEWRDTTYQAGRG